MFSIFNVEFSQKGEARNNATLGHYSFVHTHEHLCSTWLLSSLFFRFARCNGRGTCVCTLKALRRPLCCHSLTFSGPTSQVPFLHPPYPISMAALNLNHLVVWALASSHTLALWRDDSRSNASHNFLGYAEFSQAMTGGRRPVDPSAYGFCKNTRHCCIQGDPVRSCGAARALHPSTRLCDPAPATRHPRQHVMTYDDGHFSYQGKGVSKACMDMPFILSCSLSNHTDSHYPAPNA